MLMPMTPISPVTPLSPTSAFSQISGATLRELHNSTPTSLMPPPSPRSFGGSTLAGSLRDRDRLAAGSPASTLRTRVIGPFGAHSASANASVETLRPYMEAPPRHAHEYVRERPGLQRLPRIVSVPEGRPGIAEDVRASYAGGEVQFGEAV